MGGGGGGGCLKVMFEKMLDIENDIFVHNNVISVSLSLSLSLCLSLCLSLSLSLTLSLSLSLSLKTLYMSGNKSNSCMISNPTGKT